VNRTFDFFAFLALAALQAAAVGTAQAQTSAPAAPPTAATNAVSAADLANEGFFGRLNDAFLQQMGTPAYTPPDPKAAPADRRGFAAPFDSPPYPTGDWQIGGTPIIGDPGLTPDYPIMQALDEGTDGKAIKDSMIKFYGWADLSGNLSSSHDTALGQYTNAPEAYDQIGNGMVLDQLVLYLERVPNEFQTDHYDWGFRVAALYGTDYRFTTMDGFASDQLLKRNQEYGYDFPMIYADWYDPFIAQGFNLRVGRVVSMPDIEAQLSPNNLMSSHSLMYTFDPFTQIGAFASFKLSSNWTVQTSLTAGNDIAPWVHGPYGARPTFGLMIQWISNDQKDSVYFGDNGLNNERFGYNNIQMLVQTWTHKFTEKFWSTTESYYMWQTHCPVAGSPQALAATQSGFVPSGAFPTASYASEWAVLNYLNYRLAGNTYASFRNEYFDDKDGQRSGFATPYIENTVGLTWWPNSLLTVRPELRYEHALNAAPYDNGTKSHQRTLAMDVIVHF